MDFALKLHKHISERHLLWVSILVLMDFALKRHLFAQKRRKKKVSILVLMDFALKLVSQLQEFLLWQLFQSLF